MAARVVLRDRSSPLLLTCEHASAHVPSEYENLGVDAEMLADHIGWDIGAGALTAELSRIFEATAVLSTVSRLLVDCNRALSDHDLMPAVSHGVVIPGNGAMDAAERERRLESYYHPFHRAIDDVLAERDRRLLLSVHSFTSSPLGGRERDFDVGILHDDFADLAGGLARRVAEQGLRVRMNEPYSGLDGLIFSARDHGRRGGVHYLEIEVNNGLLRRDEEVRAVAARLSTALGGILAS